MSTPSIMLSWSTQNCAERHDQHRQPQRPLRHVPAVGPAGVPFTCSESQHTYYLVANGPGNQKSQQKQIVVNRDLAPTTTTSEP